MKSPQRVVIIGGGFAGLNCAKSLANDDRYADCSHDLRPAFTHRDRGMMAIIGKNAAAAESKRLDLKGYPAWIARLVIHLAFLVGFRNKLAVLLSSTLAYLVDKPGTRVFTFKNEKASTKDTK